MNEFPPFEKLQKEAKMGDKCTGIALWFYGVRLPS
jgi:hypothetical protein